MSPSDNNTGKDETEKSRKTASSSVNGRINCPRCDSANTKFCYYNNYSPTQPRHFCKTCRRYWTKGGALRNVPIGGACRRNKNNNNNNKKIIMSSSKSSSARNISTDHSIDAGSTTGMKFIQGLSPAMDFQFGGGGIQFSNKFAHNNNFNHFSSFGDLQTTTSINGNNIMGFGCLEMGSLSCIESLSSINQELHWKLLQQRLMGMGSMLFVGENNNNNNNQKEVLLQKQTQPINLFLENSSKSESCGIGTSRKDGTGNANLSTEWFFDNSYGHEVDPITNGSNNLIDDNNYQIEWINSSIMEPF
ncbi:hypothetical protein ACJIZ3_002516 [Penstemon smallii]|uniref:Dof zinc finger protein n=1 Tax=Penstemon smallii TaxID=265156 RepID=A0ABD3U9E7_9LAMI